MIKCVYNGLKLEHNLVKSKKREKKKKQDPNQVHWL